MKHRKSKPGRWARAAARRLLRDRALFDDPQMFERDALKVARVLLRITQ